MYLYFDCPQAVFKMTENKVWNTPPLILWFMVCVCVCQQPVEYKVILSSKKLHCKNSYDNLFWLVNISEKSANFQHVKKIIDSKHF